ncbi:MAG: ribonuclease H-like domain-containing protein, partial [Phycisphaerae bacterium]|nr:ribonuclease H-like domain-containing protein [Phycisphaerae bacterium]
MSESRRRKLSMLSRSLAKGDIASAARLLAQHGHSGLNRGPGAGGRPEPLPLLAACGGRASAVAANGRRLSYHLVHKKLSQLGADCLPVARRYVAVMRGAGQRFDEMSASAALCHAANARPEDPLFMDIESCGLAGASIFLVGTMAYRRGELVFRQYLARDYAEEAAILAAFSRRYARSALLVT